MSYEIQIWRHSRSGEPARNPLRDFGLFCDYMVETRGVYDDNAMVLEDRKSIAWIDNHRFEIGSAGGQSMSDFHPVFSEEGVYELSPS